MEKTVPIQQISTARVNALTNSGVLFCISNYKVLNPFGSSLAELKSVFNAFTTDIEKSQTFRALLAEFGFLINALSQP